MILKARIVSERDDFILAPTRHCNTCRFSVENALVSLPWPNSQQSKGQKAKPMILKAQIVIRWSSAMISFWLTRFCYEMFWKDWVCIEEQSENKTIQVHQGCNEILTTTWICCMLWRANSQQSNDQGETESISWQAWRVFVTVLGWPDNEPHWSDAVSSPSCRRKLQRVTLSHFGAYCCFEEVLHQTRST